MKPDFARIAPPCFKASKRPDRVIQLFCGGPKKGEDAVFMKSMRIMFGFALFCAIVCAQSDRGTVTGTVSDPTGAAVPRAEVVAIEGSSGAEYKANTIDSGNFPIASVPAGAYDLTVTASGFKTYLQKGITIQVAQIARLNVMLQVG